MRVPIFPEVGSIYSQTLLSGKTIRDDSTEILSTTPFSIVCKSSDVLTSIPNFQELSKMAFANALA